MSEHGYPGRAVLADLGRSGAGLALLGTPLAVVDTAPVVTALLAAGAAVFAVHGLRALRLKRFRLRVDGNGVGRLAPRPLAIAWHELQAVRLAYYSTHRDRSAGWMQLTMTGPAGRLAVDSRLDGFDALAARAVAAAADNGLVLDATTAANLAALGGPAARATAPTPAPDCRR